MAKSKRQRIARIRERVTRETYQQALAAVTAGGKAIPGLSPEYSSAISRDYRKGDYTALWACPECESEGVLNLQTLPVLHRLLTAEERENAIAAMADAQRRGGEEAVRQVAEDMSSPYLSSWGCSGHS